MKAQALAYGIAIGWTILHSFWQIIVVALVLKGLLLLTSNRAASLRYGLGLLAMLVVFLWAGFTFGNEWSKILPMMQHSNLSLSETMNWQMATTSPSPGFSSLEIWKMRLERIAPFLTLAWLLGVLGFSLHTIKGYYDLNCLQWFGSQLASQDWQERLSQLSHQLGVKKQVRLFLSNRINEPIAFRHFKPVVLLPLSALSGLSMEQIEVLLLHELAHIRRHDYLVNWFQSSVEVLFFYHPAIWWMSNQVRAEREHCCDDLVMKVSRNPMLYAQALTQLQINHYSIKTNLAMSATKNQGVFTTRIHRLFGKYQSQTLPRKGVVTVAFLAFAFIGLAFHQSVEQPKISTAAFVERGADTLKNPQNYMVVIDSSQNSQGEWVVIADTIQISQPDVPKKEIEVMVVKKKEATTSEHIQLHVKAKRVENETWELEHLTPNNTPENIELEEKQFERMRYLFESEDDSQNPKAIEIKLLKQAGGQVDTMIMFDINENFEHARELKPSDVSTFGFSKDSLKHPLVILDGEIIMEEEFAIIDPNNIEHIQVLKDSPAIKIYGDSGANGVIIITTKTPKEQTKKARVKETAQPAAKATEKKEKATANLEIYPNPSSDLIQLKVSLPEDAKVNLSIFDNSGKVVKTFLDGKSNGDFSFDWDASKVTSGVYTVLLVVNGEKTTKQFVVE